MNEIQESLNSIIEIFKYHNSVAHDQYRDKI